MKIFTNKQAMAWFFLVTAVALHVLDEALTDFLAFYNPLVTDLKMQLGFFPMPTFAFESWIGGLIIAILIGYSLIPLVYRGGKVIRFVTIAFGILMIFNALGHLFGSLYFGKLIPGFWSSPILIAAAINVVFQNISSK